MHTQEDANDQGSLQRLPPAVYTQGPVGSPAGQGHLWITGLENQAAGARVQGQLGLQETL